MMAKKTPNIVTNIVMNVIKEYSNLNHTCPYDVSFGNILKLCQILKKFLDDEIFKIVFYKCPKEKSNFDIFLLFFSTLGRYTCGESGNERGQIQIYSSAIG